MPLASGVYKFRRRLADHRHRNVAEAGVLRQYGEEGFHHARRKTIAHHDAVDVARVEVLGGGLHAERAHHLYPLAHRHAELGVERAAAGDQHGRVVERVADWQRRQPSVMGGEGLDAAENGRMQGAHPHGRLQSRDQPLDRQSGVGRKCDRDGGFLVAEDARDDRNDDAACGGDLPGEFARGRFVRRSPRLGDHHSGGFD